MAENSQSQKAGEGSLQIQARGNVSIGLSYGDVKQIFIEERERIFQWVWERAQQMLRESGIQLKPVPMKIVLPLSQYASTEENPDLQERWAALLANTVTSDEAVHRSFPEILRQLGSSEARLLDKAFDYLVSKATEETLDPQELPEQILMTFVEDLGTLCSLATYHNIADCRIDLDGLIRLGLLTRKWNMVRVGHGSSARHNPDDGYPIGITSNGYRFVLACRKPKKAAGR